MIFASSAFGQAPQPAAIQNIPSLGEHFNQVDTTGTFLLQDPKTGVLKGWNPERAAKRYIPASTFKIANSLIGLETGAVKSVDEVLPYGGKPQMFKEWEQDLPLRKAIEISAVPIYQELARRIGQERMAKGVASLDYGNMKTGEVVDRFWLDGPLEISAVEQVRFISRLLTDKLPLKPETLKTVREIVSRETAGDTVIHFKTGWCTATKPQIGWIVGWIEKGESNYPFALNIDMADLKDAPKRMEILKACIKSEDVL
ncbi:class D beta-lactamase [Luteolibacter luteus]|uniref:Beta-lactamase n=1 Tax=Luteolibacter luteus TaxID=2728835 RepID=A0A858RTE3_9BACT|nr:class D beta-lactamase [Luteolibacter luteus]